MNAGIKREIRRLEELGETVEVNDNEIVIANKIVPKSIAKAFVSRIQKADTENKYQVTIKPA